jgi:hypothetical protein
MLLHTVSVPDDITGYAEMRGTDGVVVLFGVPEKPALLPAFALIPSRRSIVGSLIGGIRNPRVARLLDSEGHHRRRRNLGVRPRFLMASLNETRFRSKVDLGRPGDTLPTVLETLGSTSPAEACKSPKIQGGTRGASLPASNGTWCAGIPKPRENLLMKNLIAVLAFATSAAAFAQAPAAPSKADNAMQKASDTKASASDTAAKANDTKAAASDTASKADEASKAAASGDMKGAQEKSSAAAVSAKSTSSKASSTKSSAKTTSKNASDTKDAVKDATK